jgi:hypothetical protein
LRWVFSFACKYGAEIAILRSRLAGIHALAFTDKIDAEMACTNPWNHAHTPHIYRIGFPELGLFSGLGAPLHAAKMAFSLLIFIELLAALLAFT